MSYDIIPDGIDAYHYSVCGCCARMRDAIMNAMNVNMSPEYEYECEYLAKCSTSFCVGPRAPTNPIVWPRSLFINNKIRLVATSLARSLTHMLILQVGLLLLWLFPKRFINNQRQSPCPSPTLTHPPVTVPPVAHPPTIYTCLPLCVCIECIGMWQPILARHGFQIKVLQYNGWTDSRSLDLRSTETETERLTEAERKDRKIGKNNLIALATSYSALSYLSSFPFGNQKAIDIHTPKKKHSKILNVKYV